MIKLWYIYPYIKEYSAMKKVLSIHACTQLYKDVCISMEKARRYATNLTMVNSSGGIQGCAIGLLFLCKSVCANFFSLFIFFLTTKKIHYPRFAF